MNPDNPNFRDAHCMRCVKNVELKEMIIKMGGLLCPKCRLILINAGTEIFRNEMMRRNKAVEAKMPEVEVIKMLLVLRLQGFKDE